MSRAALLAAETTTRSDHPAARAWRRLGGRAPARVEFRRAATRTKPAIYRLAFANPRGRAVFAKRYPGPGIALERTVYETLLPELPVTVARYCGSWQDPEGDAWLFLEDAGDRLLSPSDRRHRVLAARWLGLLHRSAANLPAAARLPDAGPARYRDHLARGRAAIERHFGNPGLSARDRAVLRAVVSRHDALDARWGRLERACRDLPVTLVHGDFQPKNVRIRITRAGPVPYVIDWEMAGWGVPAADVAPVCGHGLAMQIDLGAYRAAVCGRWPELDDDAVRRLAIIGSIFRALAAIEWACADLRFESPLCLLRPVSSMRLYVADLSAALAAGARWLG